MEGLGRTGAADTLLCLSLLWGWWSPSAWWCYWMQVSAAEVFPSRKHFWPQLPVFLPRRSICQSSGPVSFPAPCWWFWLPVLRMRRAERASPFIAGIALQFLALWDCSYQVPGLLVRKTAEAQHPSFLPSQYSGNQILSGSGFTFHKRPWSPAKLALLTGSVLPMKLGAVVLSLL